MMNYRRDLTNTLAMILVGGFAFGQAYRDTIEPKKGKPKEGLEVFEETYKAINWTSKDLGSQKQSYPTSRVKAVKHGDAPGDYFSATTKMVNRDFDNAITSFKRAATNKKVRPWIHPYTKYKIARCYQLSARTAEAARAYEKMLSEHSQHFLAPSAHHRAADSYLAMKDLEKALAHFKKLASTDFGDEWVLMAQDGMARVLEAKKEFKAASDKYRELVSQTRDKKNFQHILNLGYKGLGRNQLKLNQPDKAVKTFNELRGIAQQLENQPGLAVAFNGIGDCLYRTGMFEDAALQYLRVNILYALDKNGKTDKEEDSRAIYQAALCFRKLSLQQGIPKEKKLAWQARSLKLLNEVKGKYPGTPWGKRAKDELH